MPIAPSLPSIRPEPVAPPGRSVPSPVPPRNPSRNSAEPFPRKRCEPVPPQTRRAMAPLNPSRRAALGTGIAAKWRGRYRCSIPRGSTGVGVHVPFTCDCGGGQPANARTMRAASRANIAASWWRPRAAALATASRACPQSRSRSTRITASMAASGKAGAANGRETACGPPALLRAGFDAGAVMRVGSGFSRPKPASPPLGQCATPPRGRTGRGLGPDGPKFLGSAPRGTSPASSACSRAIRCVCLRAFARRQATCSLNVKMFLLRFRGNALK